MLLYPKNSEAEVNTLSECISKAGDLGYRESFNINLKGMVVENKRYVYLPEETKIIDSYPFRNSGTGKKSTLYLIETSDGKKGLLIDTLNPSSESGVSDFIKEIQATHIKKTGLNPRSWAISLREFLFR